LFKDLKKFKSIPFPNCVVVLKITWMYLRD